MKKSRLLTLKELTDRKERIAYAIANKDFLNQEKLNVVNKRCEVVRTTNIYSKQQSQDKSTATITIEEAKEASVKFVGNTYLWMDSHLDVHAKNVFNEFIAEKEEIFHLSDHDFKLKSRLGNINELYEKTLAWKTLGINKEGFTQCLVADSTILRKYDSVIFEDYLNNKINQHSVGMWYIELEIAIDDEDEKDAYKLWKEYIDKIGNPDFAKSVGVFWVVRKAGLREISAVLKGSNSITHTINSSIIKSDNEPPPTSTKYAVVGKSIMNFLESD